MHLIYKLAFKKSTKYYVVEYHMEYMQHWNKIFLCNTGDVHSNQCDKYKNLCKMRELF